MDVWPGAPYPLGPSWDGEGVNFAVFSEHAEGVEICLFAEDGSETRVELAERDGFVWHGYVPGLRPGTHYGVRAHGAFDPARGLRFNPQKLLLDPYAKAVAGDVDWGPENFGYTLGDPAEERLIRGLHAGLDALRLRAAVRLPGVH